MLLLGIVGILLLPACKKNLDPSSQPVDFSKLKPVLTDRGTPTGQASTASISPDGGTVTSADGMLTVSFPAGAFTETTEVGIQPVSNNVPLGLGSGYRLSPEGKTFAKPATLTFHYTQEILGTAVEDFLWFTTQNADGTWSGARKSVVDKINKTVTVDAPHFSDWALGRFVDLVLLPPSKVLPVNKSTNLAISGFYSEREDSEMDYLAPLKQFPELESIDLSQAFLEVTESYRGIRVKQWALNGKSAPVSNEFGKLETVVPGARYTAPGKTPSPATVAVSVELEVNLAANSVKSKFLLVSNLTILEDGFYLKLKTGGKDYVYYQYGPDGKPIPDESDYSIVNFAKNGDGSNGIAAGRIVNGQSSDAFVLTYDPNGLGGRQMFCSSAATENHDNMAFTAGIDVSGTIINGYSKRTKASDKCNIESLCAGMNLSIDDITGEENNIISGSFSGVLYNSLPANDDACQTDESFPVSGEFRLYLF